MGREITFSDLVLIFLRNIKKILIFTLIFCILFTFLGFYLGLNNQQKSINELKLKKENLEILQQTNLIFKLDAKNVIVCDKIIEIPLNVVNSQNDYTLINKYINSYNDSFMIEKFTNLINSKVDEKEYDILVYCMKLDVNNQILFRIINNSVETANDISNNLFEILFDHIFKIYGSHSIKILSSQTYSESNNAIEAYQKSINDQITSLDSQINSSKTDNSKIIIKTLKFCILGLILGFTIIFVILVAISTNNKYISNIFDFVSRYNINVLGVISKKQQLNNNCINKWINKIEESQFTIHKKMDNDILYATLKLINSEHKILFTSSISLSNLDDFFIQLEKKTGICFDFGDYIMETESTIDKLSKIDSVILIEKFGMSEYKKINNEIIQIESCNRNIIGIIFL